MTELKSVVKYDILHQLGLGKYCAIHYARNRETGLDVAIKIVNKDIIAGVHPEYIRNERLFMKLIKPCENVITYLDFLEDENHVYFILQLIDGYNLQREILERVHCRNRPILTFDQRKDIMNQIVKGVQDLHKQHIYHCDIKPENIMWGDRIYIIDFGCSVIDKKAECRSYEFWFKGTTAYKPPEVSLGNETIVDLRHIDVWALCCTFYFIFSPGKHPFMATEDFSHAVKTKIFELRYQKKDIDENILKVCEKVFKMDPLERINLEQFAEEMKNFKMDESVFNK